MQLSSDQLVFWHYKAVNLNATIVTTWFLMLVLVLLAKYATRPLKADSVKVSYSQSVLEVIVIALKQQITEVGLPKPEKYLGLLGTLFLFIATANLFTIIPGYEPPTGSLSTSTALATCVFVAVPWFGIQEQGLKKYLLTYLEPTAIMLPFNIISEFSRILALAVRLFGNMMSGSMILGILLTVTPLIFPLLMTALGLLTGMVQAYIFTILATVFIAAAATASESSPEKSDSNNTSSILNVERK
jgi:F-type H+-transporting ATPase subunit a